MEERQPKMTGLMINCLIYHKMWDQEWEWQTNEKMQKEFSFLNLKKDNIAALQDNY